jgi:hypothetical protein
MSQLMRSNDAAKEQDYFLLWLKIKFFAITFFQSRSNIAAIGFKKMIQKL